MEIGERIEVKTEEFAGMATVMYIASPKEIFPIQVELDNGDSDGHKVKRVSYKEIVKQSDISSMEDIVFESKDDPTRYVGKINQVYMGYGFKPGDKFILGPPLHYKGGISKHFLIYEYPGGRFKGCMPAFIFDFVELFDPSKVVRKPEKAKRKQQKAESVQLSLFDFMEG